LASKKYTLLHNDAYIDYIGQEEVEIGKIINLESNEDAMYIIYSRDLYRTSGYHICPMILQNKDEEFFAVYIDDLHRDCFFEHRDIFLAMMMHEYGHYINGDLMIENTTSKAVAEDRMQCIQEGRVQESERKADAFAVSIVGKNLFIRCIDYLIRKRKQRSDKGMYLAIKEFELRKKYVQRIR